MKSSTILQVAMMLSQFEGFGQQTPYNYSKQKVIKTDETYKRKKCKSCANLPTYCGAYCSEKKKYIKPNNQACINYKSK